MARAMDTHSAERTLSTRREKGGSLANSNVARLAVGYVRVSTDMQASEGLSLEAQQAAIEGYCALHGIKLLRICKDVMAVVLMERRQLDEAEPLLRRALMVAEAALSKDHPHVAVAMENLAGVLLAQGKLDEAETLLRRSLVIKETRLGKDHSSFAIAYLNLAGLSLSRGQVDQALKYIQSGRRIQEKRLRTSPTEEYATSLLAAMQDLHHLTYGLPLHRSRPAGAAEFALQTALLSKSRTLELGRLASQALKSALRTQEQQQRYQKMQDILSQSTQLFDQGVAGRAEGRAAIQALLFQAQQIEQELAREAGVSSSQVFPGMDQIVAQVAARLPAGSALVEVVLGATADFQRVADWRTTVKYHYLALVLFGDRKVHAIDLGEIEVVHSKVMDFLRALEHQLPDAQVHGQAAYQQVFLPLEPLLKARRISHLVVSPDGALQMLPWGALHDGAKYLVDRYKLQYVSAGRDLLQAPSRLAPRPALVLADPIAPPNRRLLEAREVSIALAKDLGVQPLLDEAANETNLRNQDGPYAVLLTTHGKYRDGAPVPKPAVAPQMGAGHLGSGILFARAAPLGNAQLGTEVWDENVAMHRSVLVLTPETQASTDNRQDGWLTGVEARQLRLRGTQLVTVLACESGRGAISSGQGVYGLRRAFLQAGAETVVSTLWSVQERSASELVKKYFDKLLHQKKGRVEAMEEAMKELRSDPQYQHPFYWAPFIVMGLDGPLRLPR